MDPLIIIPARFASGRFAGKPLAQIAGKPLIRWTWEAAMRSELPVVVATDNREILAAVEGFGARAMLTSDQAKNGTERCAEVLSWFGGKRLIINWQGDAPLMPAIWPHRLIERLDHDPAISVATIAIPGRAERGSVGVGLDERGRARGFERAPPGAACLLHQGIYAYRAHALGAYPRLPIPPTERMTSLEQIRWGASFGIGVVIESPPAWPLYEVNYPADVQTVERVLEGIHAAH